MFNAFIKQMKVEVTTQLTPNRLRLRSHSRLRLHSHSPLRLLNHSLLRLHNHNRLKRHNHNRLKRHNHNRLKRRNSLKVVSRIYLPIQYMIYPFWITLKLYTLGVCFCFLFVCVFLLCIFMNISKGIACIRKRSLLHCVFLLRRKVWKSWICY